MVGRYTVFSKTSMNRIFVVLGLNSLLLAETLATLTSTYFLCGGSITLPPFTLMSFKAREVTLKSAFWLYIRKGQFLLYRSLNTRSTKTGDQLNIGTSSEWYTIFGSCNFMV